MSVRVNIAVLLAMAGATAGSAFGTTVVRPVTIGTPATGDTSLGDTLAANGGGSINVSTGQSTSATFQATGSSSSAVYLSQSAATTGMLTFGIYDSSGQQAVIFDNTSPPSNPDGMGPVEPGAVAALTFMPTSVEVNVMNMNPTGFPLGYGNTDTEYTDFGNSFGFYVSDGTQTFYSDDALNADGQAHLLVYASGASTFVAFSDAAGGSFNDSVFSLTDLTAAAGGGPTPGVPEPMAIALLPLAIAGLGLRRKLARG